LIGWIACCSTIPAASNAQGTKKQPAAACILTHDSTQQQQQQQQQQRARLARSYLLYIDDMHSHAVCMYICMPLALRARYCDTSELPSYPSIHAHAGTSSLLLSRIYLFAIVPMCRSLNFESVFTCMHACMHACMFAVPTNNSATCSANFGGNQVKSKQYRAATTAALALQQYQQSGNRGRFRSLAAASVLHRVVRRLCPVITYVPYISHDSI
jgi:hypothetical protein